MDQRGRKSAAAIAIISESGIETDRRPHPPASFTADQAQEWTEIVNRLPADWFPRETLPMLELYCCHAVTARKIEQLILQTEKAEEFDIGQYDRLLKMRERESRNISSLGTRMRITQHSQYDKSKKRGSTFTAKPWKKES